MAADIQETLTAMFTGAEVPEELPSPFMLHRFLASDAVFAPLAKDVALDVRDPAMAFRVWQLLVGRRARAPRLGYVGPRKQAGPDELVLAVMDHFTCNRQQAEEYIEVYDARGVLDTVRREFGLESQEAKAASKPRRAGGRKKTP